MKVAADFTQRVVVHSASEPWVASPVLGVERKLLDRIGAEVARATSIVRFAPGSKFSEHVHHGGEEFVVLEGVFQDEHGDYPAGSYVRNPPQSSHTPSSQQGCVILVKLWQFQLQERRHVNLQMDKLTLAEHGFEGVKEVTLYQDSWEHVRLLEIAPNRELRLQDRGGIELFVLQGSLQEQQNLLLKQSWLRVPIGQEISLSVGAEGAKIWLKTGHLASVDKQVGNLQLRSRGTA